VAEQPDVALTINDHAGQVAGKSYHVGVGLSTIVVGRSKKVIREPIGRFINVNLKF
jgi:hypothetical protein